MAKLPPALLTYGWCRIAYVILHSLAGRGVEVHVSDASRLAMCRYSRRTASFSTYRDPYGNPEGFVEDISAALRSTGAGVLIPGHEDVVTVARMRDRLPGNVAVPVGDAATLTAAINKWTLIGLAERAGVSVPRSVKPETREELVDHAARMAYPAIVKTQLGNSGKGVFVVGSAEECVARYEAVVDAYSLAPERWPVLQAFARGAGYGVCVLYNRGRLRASFCERYIRSKDGQFGTSVYRESVEVPELVEQATALMDSLGWHGVAHLDFLYDEESGESALIEINPRFWGALDLAVRAGVDFPWLLYKMAVDGDVDPVTSYEPGVTSRWIVGEMLHQFNLVRRGRLVQAARTAGSVMRNRSDGCDDFRRTDPTPLLAEMLYYGTRFLATGSTNPIDEGMIG